MCGYFGCGTPFCPDNPIIIDNKSKTVTATVPYVPGSIYVPGNSVKFTLAVCASCGPGGVGGGLAFPGSGVVLDLILPILSPPSPSPLPGPNLPGGNDKLNLISNKVNPISSLRERNPLLNQSGITLVSNGLILDNLTNQKANETTSQILNTNKTSMPHSLMINGTVVFPQMGNLSLRLLGNDSNQELDVIEVTSKKDIDELNLIFDRHDGKTVVSDINKDSYFKVGSIYQPVSLCKCLNDTQIDVSIPYDVSIINSLPYTSSASRPEENLGVKLLHYEGDGKWVDVTTEVDSVNDRVRGIIDQLSPIVPVVKLTHQNGQFLK